MHRKGVIQISKIINLKNNSGSGKIEVKNISNETLEFNIYGDIVNDMWDKWTYDDVAPSDIVDMLKEYPNVKNIDIHINSAGGSVFGGMAIYNMLKNHSAHKTVYVDGLAGSISSVIMMAGDEIVVPSNSYIMIHHALCGIQGNAIELRKMAETLDVVDVGILEVYKTKLKNEDDLEVIKNFIDESTWFTGTDFEKYFNITVTKAVEVAAYTGELLAKYTNIPKELIEEELDEGIELLKAKLKLALM